MIKANPAQLLEEYRKKGYNILTPSITLEGLSPHHHATVETVQLSPKLEDGDVYPHKADNDEVKTDDRQFRIAKQGLDKLAVLAGVIWHQEGGSRRIDNGRDRDYVAFEAFGAIRKADGQLVPVKAFYDLDFVAIEEDLRANYEAKARRYNKNQDYVDYCVSRDMRSKRKHRSTLCESGARNRVIRSLLGIKKVYTGADLSKPFVCVRITYQPDYEDPEIKRLVTLAAIGAQTSLYGVVPQARLPEPDQAPYDTADLPENGEVVDTEPDLEDLDEEESPTGNNEFETWDRGSQEKYVKNLAIQKGYNLKELIERMEGVSSLADFKDIQIMKLHDKLIVLEDDDIPF